MALAERDKLGGECNHYGCVPTKVMLRSAKIAALARDGERFGLRIPEVEVDFKAVQQRARDVIESQSGEGAEPFERVGVRVFMQEARLLGEHRVELADGTQIEADKRGPRHRDGGRRSPRSPAWRTVPIGRIEKRSGDPGRSPRPSP